MGGERFDSGVSIGCRTVGGDEDIDEFGPGEVASGDERRLRAGFQERQTRDFHFRGGRDGKACEQGRLVEVRRHKGCERQEFPPHRRLCPGAE